MYYFHIIGLVFNIVQIVPDPVGNLSATYNAQSSTVRFEWSPPARDKGEIRKYSVELQDGGLTSLIARVEFKGNESVGEYKVAVYCRKYNMTIYAHTSVGQGSPRSIEFTASPPRRHPFSPLADTYGVEGLSINLNG